MCGDKITTTVCKPKQNGHYSGSPAYGGAPTVKSKCQEFEIFMSLSRQLLKNRNKIKSLQVAKKKRDVPKSK